MRPYKQPDPVQLAEAVILVRNGLLSLRQAGQRFGIPKSTLYDHLHGKVESGSRPGRRPMLPSHLEDALADQCVEAAKKGMGVSRQQLAIKTARILNRIRVPTSTAIPGKKWLSGFRKKEKEKGQERKRKREVNAKLKQKKSAVHVICAVCLAPETGKEEGIWQEWVACDGCDAWLHMCCVPPRFRRGSLEDYQHQSFLCPQCYNTRNT